MRERAVTLALAVAALVAFLAMFRSGAPNPAARQLPRPTSIERSGSGLFALGEWLRRDGRQVISWRNGYDRLATAAPSGAGHLLIVVLPGKVGIDAAEVGALDRWLRAGNTLLVLAALADMPEWAAGDTPGFELDALTSLDFARRDRPSTTARGGTQPRTPRLLASPREQVAEPSGAHPLLAGVRSLRARSEAQPEQWLLRLPFETFALELARETGSDQGVLWLRRVGAGRIIVSGYGSLLSNRLLGAGDNARFLGNVVAAFVRPDGAVLFDDGRQGLASDYDPARFYADPRLRWTIGIVVAVWLCWVMAGTRLRPPPAAIGPALPDATQLLRQTAALMERLVPPRAAARQLVTGFLRNLDRRYGLPASGGLPWQWLEARLGADSADLVALRRVCVAIDAGQRVPLPSLHNLLLRLETRLI